jgi:hypothetical protein
VADRASGSTRWLMKEEEERSLQWFSLDEFSVDCDETYEV